MTNSDAYAVKIGVIAQFADDILQPVVAAVTAAELEFRHAGRQVKFIVRHQNFIWINTLEGRQRRNGFTAKVHKGGGHQQANIFTGNINARGVTKEFTLFTQRRAKTLCQ